MAAGLPPSIHARWHALPGLVAALLLCGGCSRPAPPERAAVELKVWHTFNPEETETFNRIVSELKARRPGWRVLPTVIPFARAQNEFREHAERCSAGAPDVFRAEIPWVAELVSKGVLRQVPAAGVPPLEAYQPQARAAATYRGARWILPASLDGLALLYNRRLVPRPPSTLDELVEIARRATVDAAGRTAADAGFDSGHVLRWGFYVRADGYWFLPFLWALGGELLDPQRGVVRIDEPAAAAALGFYHDLIHTHRVAPPRPSPSNDYEDQLERFGVGSVAMIVNGPWATSALLQQPAFRDAAQLGVAPFPAGASGAPAAPLSGHGWVVSRCARDERAAWALAVELSSIEAQVTFAARSGLLPALEAAYRDARVRRQRTVMDFSRALARARPRPQHPAIARIFDDFNPAVQAVIKGDAKPAEALAAVARSWRRLFGFAPAPASRPLPVGP